MNYTLNPLTPVIQVSISGEDSSKYKGIQKCSLPANNRHRRQQVQPPSASLKQEAHCADKNMEMLSKVL